MIFFFLFFLASFSFAQECYPGNPAEAANAQAFYEAGCAAAGVGNNISVGGANNCLSGSCTDNCDHYYITVVTECCRNGLKAKPRNQFSGCVSSQTHLEFNPWPEYQNPSIVCSDESGDIDSGSCISGSGEEGGGEGESSSSSEGGGESSSSSEEAIECYEDESLAWQHFNPINSMCGGGLRLEARQVGIAQKWCIVGACDLTYACAEGEYCCGASAYYDTTGFNMETFYYPSEQNRYSADFHFSVRQFNMNHGVSFVYNHTWCAASCERRQYDNFKGAYIDVSTCRHPSNNYYLCPDGRYASNNVCTGEDLPSSSSSLSSSSSGGWNPGDCQVPYVYQYSIGHCYDSGGPISFFGGLRKEFSLSSYGDDYVSLASSAASALDSICRYHGGSPSGFEHGSNVSTPGTKVVIYRSGMSSAFAAVSFDCLNIKFLHYKCFEGGLYRFDSCQDIFDFHNRNVSSSSSESPPDDPSSSFGDDPPGGGGSSNSGGGYRPPSPPDPGNPPGYKGDGEPCKSTTVVNCMMSYADAIALYDSRVSACAYEHSYSVINHADVCGNCDVEFCQGFYCVSGTCFSPDRDSVYYCERLPEDPYCKYLHCSEHPSDPDCAPPPNSSSSGSGSSASNALSSSSQAPEYSSSSKSAVSSSSAEQPSSSSEDQPSSSSSWQSWEYGYSSPGQSDVCLASSPKLHKDASDSDDGWRYIGKRPYGKKVAKAKESIYPNKYFDILGRAYLFEKLLNKYYYYINRNGIYKPRAVESVLEFDVLMRTIEDSDGNEIRVFNMIDSINGLRRDSTVYYDGSWEVMETKNNIETSFRNSFGITALSTLDKEGRLQERILKDKDGNFIVNDKYVWKDGLLIKEISLIGTRNYYYGKNPYEDTVKVDPSDKGHYFHKGYDGTIGMIPRKGDINYEKFLTDPYGVNFAENELKVLTRTYGQYDSLEPNYLLDSFPQPIYENPSRTDPCVIRRELECPKIGEKGERINGWSQFDISFDSRYVHSKNCGKYEIEYKYNVGGNMWLQQSTLSLTVDTLTLRPSDRHKRMCRTKEFLLETYNHEVQHFRNAWNRIRMYTTTYIPKTQFNTLNECTNEMLASEYYIKSHLHYWLIYEKEHTNFDSPKVIHKAKKEEECDEIP